MTGKNPEGANEDEAEGKGNVNEHAGEAGPSVGGQPAGGPAGGASHAGGKKGGGGKKTKKKKEKQRSNAPTIIENFLRKSKHFTKLELEALVELHGRMGILDRNRFRQVLYNTFGMNDDMLMDRMFRIFDKDVNGVVSCDEWLSGLATIIRGSLQEKIKYTFEVYDLNSDGFITRDEIFHLLKASLVKQPMDEDPDEGVKDLLDVALKLLDLDHDARISFQDYTTAVSNQPLLLEAFGPCIPNEDCRAAFLATVVDEKEKDKLLDYVLPPGDGQGDNDDSILSQGEAAAAPATNNATN